MPRKLYFVSLLLILSGFTKDPVQDSKKMPNDAAIIRFLYTKSSSVNARYGPGFFYPIKYFYKKRGIPLVELDNVDGWIKIMDIDGDQSWIFKPMLSTKGKLVMINEKTYGRRGNCHKSVSVELERLSFARFIDKKEDCCLLAAENKKFWTNCESLWGISDYTTKKGSRYKITNLKSIFSSR